MTHLPAWLLPPLLVAACLGALVAVWRATDPTAPVAGAAGLDPFLQTGAAWLLLGCLGWGLVVTAALTVELLSSGRVAALRRVGCPRALRVALLTACGVGLAASPTYAAGGSGHSGLDGLPLPERPDGQVSAVATNVATNLPTNVSAQTSERTPQAGPQPPSATTVVQPGDTLWAITDAHGEATAAEVARVYAANRDVIGDDPDLILPGQRLVIPTQRPTSEVTR